MISEEKLSIELLMRGTRDGFSANAFHQLCNKKGNTITIVKSASHQKVFGGYTDIEWTSSNSGKQQDGNSFLFSLRPDDELVKLEHKKKGQ